MSRPPVASVATEFALELPVLLRLVAHLAASDLGRQAIAELRPFERLAELEGRRRRYQDARRLLAARSLVPHCERAFWPLLTAIEDGGHSLEGRDLVEVATLLSIASEAAGRIAEAEPPLPELAALVEHLPACAELQSALRKTFDPRGEIRENATPRLAELRSRLRRVRDRTYRQLGSLVEKHREHLSEDTIPLRGGRLVLVLQAGARGRLPGLLHGRSGSGRSFYVEPLEAVESNNQLQQIGDQEAAEKRRILADLIRRLADELPALHARAAFVAELDLLQASVHFAGACDGRLADLGRRQQLTLVAARHPLLDPGLAELRREALDQPGHTGSVVPLDLELTAEQRALVVTGPNAGGKTVALKTAGLLAMAHLCGLPIPAGAGSRLPFLSKVVATVGDDQDLLADRSTFSGRLLRLREAWEAAEPGALILLDELGSGTDPEEGSALATALLESLAGSHCLVLITTHLSQLAVAALETDGALCAAMQFDSETGHPTYRLLPGPPGGSEALALARRLELPAAWLDRAEELLGSEHQDLRRLLAEVERSRQELAERHRRLEVEQEDAVKLRQRLAEQNAALSEERKALNQTFKRRLEAFQEETRKRFKGEAEKLRAEFEGGRRRNLAAAATERVFQGAPEFETAEEETDGEITVGAAVKHRRLGWIGTLEKLDRGRAQVRVGGKALRCRGQDLTATAITAGSMGSSGPRGAAKTRPRPPATSPAAPTSLAATMSLAADLSLDEPPRELKLIGQRVEPALELLDRFLDRSLLASLAEVRIIHGHGSGRLRTAVRQHLRSHPAVVGHRAGGKHEGGDGATVAKLQED